jgi:hypothetical protein
MRPTVEELLQMPSISTRRYLIEPFLLDTPPVWKPETLLQTIKIPGNIGQVKLPRPSYGKKPQVVKPIEQRIHIKNGPFGKKALESLSSPELKLVCERDWWSPVKCPISEQSDDEAEEESPLQKPGPPGLSARLMPLRDQPQIIAPRKNPIVGMNPRIKWLAHV